MKGIAISHKENSGPIFRYVYADTQKELTAKLRQNINAYQGVDLTEESKMALSEWLDHWLEQMSSVLRPSTLDHYRNDLEHHVKPYLGKKGLTQITADDLRKLYDTLKQRGRVHPRPGQSRRLSTTTVHGIHTTLHHALKSAVDQRLLPYNPADHVEPPKVANKTMHILNDEQLDTFLSAVEHDSIWHDFFYTELTTGLRLGEICGLMWSDFDARKGTLRVNRTLHKEKGGRVVVGAPKTCAGTRTIVLPSSTAELLRLRKKASFSAWIFHNPLQPEAPMNPATAYHQLKNILAKTKLECAAKLAQLWDALKEPTLDQPKPEILLADWLDLCYQEYKKPNLLPNTQMSYERRIYQHIILKLGQIQPDKLNTTDIQEFYVSLKKDGRLIRVEFYGKGLSD